MANALASCVERSEPFTYCGWVRVGESRQPNRLAVRHDMRTAAGACMYAHPNRVGFQSIPRWQFLVHRQDTLESIKFLRHHGSPLGRKPFKGFERVFPAVSASKPDQRPVKAQCESIKFNIQVSLNLLSSFIKITGEVPPGFLLMFRLLLGFLTIFGRLRSPWQFEGWIIISERRRCLLWRSPSLP